MGEGREERPCFATVVMHWKALDLRMWTALTRSRHSKLEAGHCLSDLDFVVMFGLAAQIVDEDETMMTQALSLRSHPVCSV